MAGSSLNSIVGSIPKKIRHSFAGAPPSVCLAFVLFGLINNILYVIILSAALDLVGPNIPKGMVLLFDVVPSFLTKLVSPYFIHLVPYHLRICIFVALSFAGMQLVSYGDSISMKMVGVVLASISSGGGESTFLALTHYYGSFALAFWSSGTGLAGIFGGGLYLAMTTWWGLGVKRTLVILGFLPFIMLMAYFLVLPLDALKTNSAAIPSVGRHGYAALSTSGEDFAHQDHHPNDQERNDATDPFRDTVAEAFSAPNTDVRESRWKRIYASLQQNMRRSQKLVIPYMLPLLLVFISEYTINQGVTPTLLFPLDRMPMFKNYRDAYPTYNTIYQTGVFISRSSIPFVRVRHLYLPSILQLVNLLLLTSHAVFNFIPNIYIIFLIILWEGILGGLVYVNTFAEISNSVPFDEREFSLAATSVSDSGGVCVAGFISMGLETWLCGYQVRQGRRYCKLT